MASAGSAAPDTTVLEADEDEAGGAETTNGKGPGMSSIGRLERTASRTDEQSKSRSGEVGSLD